MDRHSFPQLNVMAWMFCISRPAGVVFEFQICRSAVQAICDRISVNGGAVILLFVWDLFPQSVHFCEQMMKQ